MQSTDIRK